MDSEPSEGKIPIIKLYRDLIVVVQGSLTDRAVAHLEREATRAIERYDALGLVIDVSGIDIMDSYISRTIHDLAMIARFMGVDTVVSGINPAIALTLVEMGLVLGGIPTELNLERGLERLQKIRRKRRRLRAAAEREQRQEDEEQESYESDEGLESDEGRHDRDAGDGTSKGTAS